MVKKIEAYQTTDGTLFLSELEAYKYECDYLYNMVSNPTNIRKNKEVLSDFITVSGIRIEFEKCYKITDLMPYLSFNGCNIPHSPGIYICGIIKKKEKVMLEVLKIYLEDVLTL